MWKALIRQERSSSLQLGLKREREKLLIFFGGLIADRDIVFAVENTIISALLQFLEGGRRIAGAFGSDILGIGRKMAKIGMKEKVFDPLQKARTWRLGLGCSNDTSFRIGLAGTRYSLGLPDIARIANFQPK